MNDMLFTLVLVVGLIGGTLAALRFGRSSNPHPRPVTPSDIDFPLKPKWKPTVPVDIPRTIQTFAYYTDRKKTFAVFSHGTCVVLADGSHDLQRQRGL